MNRAVLTRSLAVVSTASALAVVLPSAAFAAGSTPFSGQSSGAVASSQLATSTLAGTAATAAATIGESTAAVNSAGHIVPAVPGFPGNQNRATAVGTATPVRVVAVAPLLGTVRSNPGSVESTAPGPAAGTRTILGVTATAGPAHATVAVGRASTASTANPNGSNPAARGDVTLTNTTSAITPPAPGVAAAALRVPVSSSHSSSSQSGGVVRAQNTTSASRSTAGVAITALNGFITADQISSLSRSVAGGGRSANTTNFAVSNLRLRSAPGGPALLTVSGQKATGGNVALTITLDQGVGLAPVTQTITIPGGKNLLDPASYTGTTLAPAFTVFGPLVAPLISAGSPLAHLMLALGAGYSDSGNGTYARGLINAVQLSTTLPTGQLALLSLGQSFSAADAVRAFSTATNPALPAGTIPTTNPVAAFPGTHQAVPVQTVCSNPVPTSPTGPTGPGGPGAPGGPGGLRPGSPLAGSPLAGTGTTVALVTLTRPAPAGSAQQPATVPAGQNAAAPAPAGQNAAAPAPAGQLPFTGLDATALLGLALLMLVTGIATCTLARVTATRPGGSKA